LNPDSGKGGYCEEQDLVKQAPFPQPPARLSLHRWRWFAAIAAGAALVVFALLTKQERVDEAPLLAQLDKVLDVERELKHFNVGAGVAIKNLPTPEQQTKLREIVKDGGPQLAEDTRKRLSEKVERVKAGAQK